MRIAFLINCFILGLLFSCDTSSKKKRSEENEPHIDTLAPKISKGGGQLDKNEKTVQKFIQPVLGYRFILSGDFDGDGKEEKLAEHYFSKLDNKEANKFYKGLSNYDQLVDLTIMKEPFSFVISDNKQIDTLYISSGGQLLGLSYLKNEGDLNGDGRDEVSYVVNWADYSNLNTWHIATYRNKRWTEIYSFPIWDWQLPDLPETINQYGLFGLERKIIDTPNETINKIVEKKFIAFKGLVRKLGTNRIEVIYRNNEAEEDTMIINLKRLNRINGS